MTITQCVVKKKNKKKSAVKLDDMSALKRVALARWPGPFVLSFRRARAYSRARRFHSEGAGRGERLLNGHSWRDRACFLSVAPTSRAARARVYAVTSLPTRATLVTGSWPPASYVVHTCDSARAKSTFTRSALVFTTPLETYTYTYRNPAVLEIS